MVKKIQFYLATIFILVIVIFLIIISPLMYFKSNMLKNITNVKQPDNQYVEKYITKHIDEILGMRISFNHTASCTNKTNYSLGEASTWYLDNPDQHANVRDLLLNRITPKNGKASMKGFLRSVHFFQSGLPNPLCSIQYEKVTKYLNIPKAVIKNNKFFRLISNLGILSFQIRVTLLDKSIVPINWQDLCQITVGWDIKDPLFKMTIGFGKTELLDLFFTSIIRKSHFKDQISVDKNIITINDIDIQRLNQWSQLDKVYAQHQSLALAMRNYVQTMNSYPKIIKLLEYNIPNYIGFSW